MELSPDKVSASKEEFKVFWMEFDDTDSCESNEDSSLLLSLKHVLYVISYLNLNLSICCTCKDWTQNSSKIQDKISAASCC